MTNRPQAAAKKAFPVVVRHAVHDLTQPLQALRMLLGLPGVVAEDSRELPRKLDAALTEMEARLAQVQALARVLDGSTDVETPRLVSLADVLALARRGRPELWADPLIRVRNPDAVLNLPPRAAALCLNALVDNARRARPKSRIVVGPREGGRRLIVLDDGDGMNRATAARIARALAGGEASVLGVGLALAASLVAGWAGEWRVASTEGVGSIVGFSAANPA